MLRESQRRIISFLAKLVARTVVQLQPSALLPAQLQLLLPPQRLWQKILLLRVPTTKRIPGG